MKKFLTILVVVVIVALGGYGMYRYIQNQKSEDAQAIQIADEVANTQEPQLNNPTPPPQQSSISTTTHSPSWSYTNIDGSKIPYPTNWTVVPPEQPSSTCTVNCLAAMHGVGSLAVKLVPSGQTVGTGYLPNIIYIDSPGEGGTPDSGMPLTCTNEPAGVFMFCAQISDGILHVPTGSQTSIVIEAQQIVAQWKTKIR